MLISEKKQPRFTHFSGLLSLDKNHDSTFSRANSRYQLLAKFTEKVNIFGKEVSVNDNWTEIKKTKSR